MKSLILSITLLLSLMAYADESLHVAEDENHQGVVLRGDVRKVVRDNLKVFKKCYTDELKIDQSLKGKIVLGWSFSDEGVVTKSWIKSSTINNKSVEDCLMAGIKMAKFPNAPKGKFEEVYYPFVFENNKK